VQTEGTPLSSRDAEKEPEILRNVVWGPLLEGAFNRRHEPMSNQNQQSQQNQKPGQQQQGGGHKSGSKIEKSRPAKRAGFFFRRISCFAETPILGVSI
jgi:hypothetical protein